MTKEELIKELEELRDIKNYSQSELVNTGYKTAMLDALDLVNKYFDLALVVGQSEQLVAFLKWVGDGYDFENNAEKIVKEYIDEGN
jgi:hypothetical protein